MLTAVIKRRRVARGVVRTVHNSSDITLRVGSACKEWVTRGEDVKVPVPVPVTKMITTWYWYSSWLPFD